MIREGKIRRHNKLQTLDNERHNIDRQFNNLSKQLEITRLYETGFAKQRVMLANGATSDDLYEKVTKPTEARINVIVAEMEKDKKKMQDICDAINEKERKFVREHCNWEAISSEFDPISKQLCEFSDDGEGSDEDDYNALCKCLNCRTEV